MHTSNLILYVVIGFFAILVFLNLIKIFMNIFSTKAPVVKEEEDPFVAEVRADVESQVKPHLTSLEGMYKKSESKAESLSAFVFSVFKDKFSTQIERDEKLVEEEICKCCSSYEGAECKESFCLEGSGLSCPK